MLDINDFVPIDLEYVFSKRNEIYNIPNSGWSDIERDINTINDKLLPVTLRTYLLNHLPYCVIEILSELNSHRVDKFRELCEKFASENNYILSFVRHHNKGVVAQFHLDDKLIIRVHEFNKGKYIINEEIVSDCHYHLINDLNKFKQ